RRRARPAMGTSARVNPRLESTLQAEVDDLVEGLLLRAVAERRQRRAGGGAVGAGALQGLRERAMGAQELDRLLEITLLLLKILERAAPEALLLGPAAIECQYDRERDLAFAEIVAHGLAELRL